MSKKLMAYKITLQQIDGNIRNLRYLTSVMIPGIYSILVHNYGLGRSEDVMEGMKDAIYDFIAEEFGFEPTFESEESYDWWNGLCDDWFNQNFYSQRREDYEGDLYLKTEHKFEGYLFEE